MSLQPGRSDYQEVAVLIEAMDQLLSDMGPQGQSVCLVAKAKARIALEPFLDDERRSFLMSIEDALFVVEEPPA